MNVVEATPEEAVADVFVGASIAIGGFGIRGGVPTSLIVALRDQGVKDLTIVCNSFGGGDGVKAQMLVENGQVSKAITCLSSRSNMREAADDQIEQGALEVELVPQGILVERLRAAGAGLAGFFSPTGIGTPIVEGKEIRLFDGEPFVLETALKVDFAFIRAWRADRLGNVQFRGSNIHFGVCMAKAARVTIVEVDEIVDAGEIPPELVMLPGIFVTRIVKNTVPLSAKQRTSAPRRSADIRRLYNNKPGRTRTETAQRVLELLPEGGYVNIGSGMPGLIPQCVGDRQLMFHGENGILGYGPVATGDQVDLDIFAAGGNSVTPRPGMSYFESVTSFEIARGHRLDVTILGGYQVDEEGSLANYSVGDPTLGGIGGAMDLIAGKKTLIVMMEHRDSKGGAKLVKRCTLPLTGVACVDFVVTDLGSFRWVDGEFVLEEVVDGFTPEEVIGLTDMSCAVSPDLTVTKTSP